MGRKASPQSSGREAAPFAGLTFAVYARMSRDDVRGEEHTSPARQISQATDYVEDRGGRLDPAHVYSDERISGDEFRNRQALLRRLGALNGGRPPFDPYWCPNSDYSGCVFLPLHITVSHLGAGVTHWRYYVYAPFSQSLCLAITGAFGSFKAETRVRSPLAPKSREARPSGLT